MIAVVSVVSYCGRSLRNAVEILHLMHFSSDEPHLPRAQLPPVVGAFPVGQYSCKGGKPTLYTAQSALAKFPNWSVFQWGAPHGSQARGTPPSRVGSSGLLIPATSTKLAPSHQARPQPSTSVNSTFQTHHTLSHGGAFAHTSPAAFPVFKGHLSALPKMPPLPASLL